MNTQDIKAGLPVFASGMSGEVFRNSVGTVDHVDAERYVKLRRSDSTDGKHHWFPLQWVKTVNSEGVFLNVSEGEFRRGVLDKFPNGLSTAV